MAANYDDLIPFLTKMRDSSFTNDPSVQMQSYYTGRKDTLDVILNHIQPQPYTFVFTGTLNHCTRDVAALIVASKGHKAANSVTKNTTHLVIGGNTVNDGYSSKEARADELIDQGVDIKIITEQEFRILLGI